MWPAMMFAKRRIINAIGLMNSDTISISTSIGFIQPGTPGGFSKCIQKCFLLLASITINDSNARHAVTAILPVKLAPPGRRPSKLLIQIKKKIVSSNGMYFL